MAIPDSANVPVSSRVPFEIWDFIFSALVYIPLFLEDHPRTFDAVARELYSISDNRRKTLRLVCKLWRDVVDKCPQHYIRLWDWAMYKMPDHVLIRATRISLSLPAQCGKCWNGACSCGSRPPLYWLDPPSGLSTVNLSWASTHRLILYHHFLSVFRRNNISNVKILDISQMVHRDGFEPILWRAIPHLAENLSALSLTGRLQPDDLAAISVIFPGLRHLNIGLASSDIDPAQAHDYLIQFPELQSLTVRSPVSDLGFHQFFRWDMPQLEEFSLGAHDYYTDIHLNELELLLPHCVRGVQRLSLFTHTLKATAQFWHLFPRLEIVTLISGKCPRPETPPPYHPLRGVRVSNDVAHFPICDPTLLVMCWINVCPMVKLVQLDDLFQTMVKTTLSNTASKEQVKRISRFIDCANALISSDITIVDGAGERWDEAIAHKFRRVVELKR